MSHRRSIDLGNMTHGGNPIPAASRVGPLVMSGGIAGTDSDGVVVESPAGQVDALFENVRSIISKAEASLSDIVKMTFFVRDTSLRALINERWVEAFPDAHARPARHLVVYHDLPSPLHLQCDFVAYVCEESS